MSNQLQLAEASKEIFEVFKKYGLKTKKYGFMLIFENIEEFDAIASAFPKRYRPNMIYETFYEKDGRQWSIQILHINPPRT